MQPAIPFQRLILALLAIALGAVVGVGGATASAAITFGQLDNFQNGTTMNWVEGLPSPNPPINVANGGPAGAGDRYLQNISSGGGGAGSRQLMFNQVQWAGNFNAAGVTRLSLQMANFGDDPLAMRITVRGPAGTRFSSTSAFSLPADGVWRQATFGLTTAALTRLFGTESLAAVLADVTDFRILTALAGPTDVGDAVVSTLGMDNLRALRLRGDTDFNNRVDVADLGNLSSNYGRTSGAVWGDGDFNFDAKVNVSDLGDMASNYGNSDPVATEADGPVTVLPDPASGVLVFALLSLLLCRWRFVTLSCRANSPAG